jgi:hypothetical protein
MHDGKEITWLINRIESKLNLLSLVLRTKNSWHDIINTFIDTYVNVDTYICPQNS